MPSIEISSTRSSSSTSASVPSAAVSTGSIVAMSFSMTGQRNAVVGATVHRAGRTFDSPAFTVNGVVVWGFTGIVLSGLFDQLGWSVPWDRNRLHPMGV